MTNETQAVEVDSGITFDNEIDKAIAVDASEGSAPQKDENPAVEKPEQSADETKPAKEDGFQKRINKVTADKWEATRRADAAEAKLSEMQSTQPAKQLVEPKLENFDYDEQKFNSALIDYKVEIKAKSLQKEQQDHQAQQSQAEITKKFNLNSAKFAEGKDDFNEVLGKVPVLQPAVLNELMSRENGPELAYFLGNHSDIADEIITMNPVAAGIKIGEISRKLAEPKQIKPSDAPDPIDPLKGSGVTAKERGPKGATFE